MDERGLTGCTEFHGDMLLNCDTEHPCPSGKRSLAGAGNANQCITCTASCVAGTYDTWVPHDTSHQKMTKCVKSCSGGTDAATPITTYRCAAGYHGTANTTSPGTCEQCPLIPTALSNGYGNSVPGANAESTTNSNESVYRCFALANTTYNDDTGSYQFQDAPCYYQ
jgi:hypothetical protein